MDYIIHDGWRLGLEGDHLVFESKKDGMECCFSCSSRPQNESCSDQSHGKYCIDQPVDLKCGNLLLLEVALYVLEFGFKPSNSNFTFNRIGKSVELRPPTLNISVLNSAYRQHVQGSPIDSVCFPEADPESGTCLSIYRVAFPLGYGNATTLTISNATVNAFKMELTNGASPSYSSSSSA